MTRNNGDVKYYSMERATPDRRDYLGKVGYSHKAIKRNNERNRKSNNKSRLQNFATGALIVSLGFGGVAFWADKIVDATSAVTEAYVEHQAANEAYREAQKPVAYTNYTDMQLNSMSFDSKINLYRCYLDYVNRNAELPYQYTSAAQGLPDSLNFAKASYEADLAYQDYLQTYSGSNGLTDINEARQASLRVISKYQSAMRMIDEVFKGKYSLNVENADDSYNIIEQVNETNSNVRKL